MDSEEEALDDLEFDGSSDDNDIDEDILDALEEDLAAEEASEAAADVSGSTRLNCASRGSLGCQRRNQKRRTLTTGPTTITTTMSFRVLHRSHGLNLSYLS